jgi:hypothetical protein
VKQESKFFVPVVEILALYIPELPEDPENPEI